MEKHIDWLRFMQEQSAVSVSFTEVESDLCDLPHLVLVIRVGILIVLTDIQSVLLWGWNV